MKKWLFVALGLLAAVPVHSRTVGLAWGTWSGSSFEESYATDGLSFNGTNTTLYSARFEGKNISRWPLGLPVDADGLGADADITNPSIKLVVTGTAVTNGYLGCTIQRSMDGKNWETDGSCILVPFPNTSLTGATAYSGTIRLFLNAQGGSNGSGPATYYRAIVNNGGGATAQVTGAQLRLIYADDRDYEMVSKRGRWTIDANTVKDTTTIVGFAQRDTTDAFYVGDISPAFPNYPNTASGADSLSTLGGAFLVLVADSSLTRAYNDSLYVATDVSYNGGYSWHGIPLGTSLGAKSNQFNSYITTAMTDDYGTAATGNILWTIPLTVAGSHVTNNGANNRTTLQLWGATHVRFRIAARASVALPTLSPYLIYWRRKV